MISQTPQAIQEMYREEVYKNPETQTYYFGEIFEHALFHGDKEFDFSKTGIDYMTPEELLQVNWPLLRKYVQLSRAEEPEDDDDTELSIDEKKRAMTCCVDRLKELYNSDLGLPDPETLPWERTESIQLEVSTEGKTL